MSLDGRILYRARQALDEKRRENEYRLELRRAEAYKANPQIKNLETEIRRTMLELIGATMSGGNIEEIKTRNLALQSSLIFELTDSGFPANYLDMHYDCKLCSDTGYVSGKMCSCLRQKYNEEQAKELSNLLKLSEDTFDNFSLEYYDSTVDHATGISPRKQMEIVREVCWSYASRFSPASGNLLLYGSTGLGKTFLSTCIAKVVSEKGYSVVYDTAGSVFSKFEEEKFSREDDNSEAKSDIARYLSCDLMILDDLGTEMTTAFTVSALYNLINTRLTTKGKKTIISTNLLPVDISKRYSPQIASRILGEYSALKFVGKDIRLLKNDIL